MVPIATILRQFEKTNTDPTSIWTAARLNPHCLHVWNVAAHAVVHTMRQHWHIMCRRRLPFTTG